VDGTVKKKLAALADSPVLWDCPLREYTSFAIGGPATALITVEGLAELQRLLAFLGEQKIAWRMIGKGTNLLVSDAGFDGVILTLGKGFAKIIVIDEAVPGAGNGIVVQAGAGCSLARLVNWCGEQGFSGLEFAAGIPGTIGGAVIMNAGAWGDDIAGVLASVTVVTPMGEIRTLPRAELDFGYRIWHDYLSQLQRGPKTPGDGAVRLIVVGVELSLAVGDGEQIRNLCQSYREQRRMKQPKQDPSAGSFFKNPEGDAAGRLIEASGLKGMKVGGAMVSPVHANFLVNCGGATAADVLELMKKVQATVQSNSGVLLEPEVHFL
jgi:UDP-N-acetylmuramate dehydrogenase